MVIIYNQCSSFFSEPKKFPLINVERYLGEFGSTLAYKEWHRDQHDSCLIIYHLGVYIPWWKADLLSELLPCFLPSTKLNFLEE